MYGKFQAKGIIRGGPTDVQAGVEVILSDMPLLCKYGKVTIV